MKLIKLACFVFLSVLLVACGSTSSDDQSSSIKKQKQVEFKIVSDKKFDSTEQKEIRVTTKASKEKDLKQITEDIMKKYEDDNLDSIHLYIHAPDKDIFGDLKAHSFIAYTQKGSAQVGVDKADSYKIEMEAQTEENKESTSSADSNDQSSKKWQDSFKQIALSEAGTYIELTEKKGKLAADRLQEHSKLIEMQADKMVNKADKQQFMKLSELVLSDNLAEVKKLKDDLEK